MMHDNLLYQVFDTTRIWQNNKIWEKKKVWFLEIMRNIYMIRTVKNLNGKAENNIYTRENCKSSNE